MKRLLPILAVAFIASCAQTPPPAPVAKLKDNEQAIPAGYKTWSAGLRNVQRPDAKQVRDIYVNDIGAKAVAGGAFPNGTTSVMELYAAKVAADGTLEKGADGNLVKGNLLKIFVMGKDEGWGQDVPENLRNGNWIYSAYLADGKPAPDPIAACRGCHLPIGPSKDFFARYDQFFQSKK